ncbi:dienelactone hydrolase family protein [Actinokineospora iranica]|uniref:Dienelactone hydrolase n=1 Tax=Actinokineospora iranica TaxID=1271860 RepID=A0A1G6XPF5_9PSEU|nr:alpha/beta family hydrolase [Actinokineospora iranica]SDD79643.1 Dienelactone hydrolase [Actinokineospora iranica]
MGAVEIPTAGVRLAADVTAPADAVGLVLFAHGSGSSRHSPRNQAVAAVLTGHGLATVLMDLLTEAEERSDAADRRARFAVDMLADRLVGAVDWLGNHADTQDLPVGLFGASTGAAAALIAAAARPDAVRAVVSRGGRPDLAGPALPQVRAATLLIVGERDPEVLDLNRRALAALTAPAESRTIPGATHLFEEPGTLAEVARLAAAWFVRHLAENR